jgi:hypothetical protein
MVRLALAFTLLLQAAPEKDNGSALVRKMEEKLLKAKTIQLKFSQKGNTGLLVEGGLLLAEGNRVRVDYSATQRGEKMTQNLRSDGSHVLLTENGRPGKSGNTPTGLGGDATVGLSRLGMVPAPWERLFRGSLAKGGPLKDQIEFKEWALGEKGKVGTHATQVVIFQVGFRDRNDFLKVELTIDVETGLPIQRVLHLPDDVITESYSDLRLDGEIAADQFILPK